MYDVLAVRRADARCNGANEFLRTLRRHRSFVCQDLVKRSSLDKLHHQKRHRAAHDAEVSHGDDVLMTDRGRRQGLLAKTRREHWIVSDQIRQNDFYCVRGFEEDVPRLKDDAHASLPETSLEQVAGIKCRFPEQRRRSLITILRTVTDLIRVTTPAGGTLFHRSRVYKITPT